MAQKTQAARVVAKLLASRRTSITEIPDLIENVERALSTLDAQTTEARGAETSGAPQAPTPTTAAPRAKRIAAPRPAREPAPEAAETPEAKPAQPVLLRRAAVVPVVPLTPPPQSLAASTGAVRGVVQWFDTRTNRGTLRLQGQSNDIPVDGEALTASGLTRLFKGQEIEATLDNSDEAPKIALLRLLNLSPNSPVMGGMVRDRHAKQVVVELKREALSRAAARAEAELLLPSRRAR